METEKTRITEEEYLIGEANGISRANVYQRWWHYGWSIERATTEPVPVKKDSQWDLWKETATANGVSNSLYNNRLKKMTPEQAATIPVGVTPPNPRKLTPSQEAEVLELWKTGKYKQIELAKKYDVSRTMIYFIVHGKRDPQ